MVVCICVCMYVYVHVYMRACVYVCMHIYRYVCMLYIGMYVCMHIGMCVCMCIQEFAGKDVSMNIVSKYLQNSKSVGSWYGDAGTSNHSASTTH